MKTNTILLVLLIILFSIISLGCVENTTPELVENPSTTTPTAQSFNIGDTVDMGNFRITVNGIGWDAGDEFFKPEIGEDWILIDATIENIDNEVQIVSSLLMFSLIDNEHFSRDMEIFANTAGSLDGELSIGRKMRGEVAFVVKESQTEWEFIFNPNIVGFGQAIYTIKR